MATDFPLFTRFPCTVGVRCNVMYCCQIQLLWHQCPPL
uniref:Uncharacterized protein n=1 Tax=Anguilla anguilla TaxID=7936 RepID=A0A0E9S276_ANGAN